MEWMTATSEAYMAVAILALLMIAVAMFFVNKDRKQKRLSPLAGLAFAFVICGIICGSERITGYALICVGLFLAVVDILISSKAIPKKA